MKRLFVFIFITLILMLTTLTAYGEPQLEMAPVNPAYLDYIKAKESRKNFVAFTEEGHKLGEMPATVVPNFNTFFSKNRGQAGQAVQADSVYDLRTAGLVTSIKNQSACANCWTFSTMSSLEGRWKKMGLGDFDLSENNLMNCHGFVFDPCNGGGNIWISMAYLTRKSGPISEADDPYVTATATCKTGIAEQAYVTDVRLLPKDSNTIKQAIIDYGVLFTTMYMSDSYYNSSNKTYYYNAGTITNHGVSLIGWDDNKVTAGGIGAWIIKNTWGTSWGENGFFYISYNDTAVNSSVGYFPNRLNYDANSKVYYYDKLGWISSIGYGTNIGYGLTKFTAARIESLSKVGTYVNSSNATVDIEIYSAFNGTTLSGLLGSISNQSCTYPGYYTFSLSSPISLSNRSDFYIKVKYNTPSYNYPMPTEMAYSGYANPTIVTGKNWVSSTGTSWIAVGGGTSYAYNLCIKGYTTIIQDTSPKYLKITGTNQLSAGISQTITITAYDEYNNLLTGYAGDKTLTFTGANSSSNPAASPTCTNKNNATVSFGTETIITFANSAATTNMKLYKAETALIAVTDGTISTTNDAYKLSVNVTGGTKSKLLWAVQPESPVSIGATWQPFSIEITDDYGNRTNNTDLIQISSSSGYFGGTTKKNAISGLATFNNITYNTSGSIVVYGESLALTATDPSNSVSIVDATTGAISITLQPQDAIDAGAKWRVNGGVWQDSGGVVSSLTAANYIVDFKDVTGWVKPNNLTLTVESGKTNNQIVNYNPTPVTKPVPTVGPAMDVTYNSARLTGNIMPNGGVTTYYFSYGISIYDNKTEIVNIGSGTTPVVIEKTINNLSPNTKYFFQIFAENSAGSMYSSDNSFTTKSAPASNMKAIIVAGGHSKEEGNNIWDSTLTCANIAYKALIYQGIDKNKIRYLCQITTIDADNNGKIDDIYNIATNDNLYDAIVNWAVLDTKDLVLYLVDHGGPKTFLMRKGEYLYAEQLKSWLDSLQQTITGKVVLIYDACYSGSFVSVLKPPAGKERIIITSTDEKSTDKSAIFLNSAMSFSYLFWTRIENNFNFCDAYLNSKNDIHLMFSQQFPMIDANGDGISNSEDNMIARNFQIGIGKGTGSPPPEIGGPVSEPKIITVNENSALIYAENITSPEGILRVWAVVTPPNCTSGSSGTPLTDLPEFNLKNLTGTNRYEAAYNGFTKPGTYNITIFANDQKGFISQPKSTKVQVGAATGATSFDGDGKTDLLWRNKANGKVAIWLMNGTAIQSYDITGTVEDLNWEIINTGDFDGDGKSDLLWRNKANGKAAIWLMNGTAISSYAITGEVSDLNWEIINVGDFNGDGKTDLLWRNKSNGKVAIWLMNGTAILSYDITGEVSDLNWEIINVGDFNGDGKSDLLWRNKGNGKVAIWLMNGTAISSYDITGEVSDLNWEIINTGDFNGDGKSDLLWRNKANGKIAIWLMNGTAISSYDITGEVSDLNWEIINTGDFNGDGKTDFLWKHKTSGKIAIWLINGTAISSYDITGEVSDLNWEIINVGDFNGDGKTDFLWRNKANGKIAIWLINGTAISSYDITGEVSDLNWGINNKKRQP